MKNLRNVSIHSDKLIGLNVPIPMIIQQTIHRCGTNQLLSRATETVLITKVNKDTNSNNLTVCILTGNKKSYQMTLLLDEYGIQDKLWGDTRIYRCFIG